MQCAANIESNISHSQPWGKEGSATVLGGKTFSELATIQAEARQRGFAAPPPLSLPPFPHLQELVSKG